MMETIDILSQRGEKIRRQIRLLEKEREEIWGAVMEWRKANPTLLERSEIKKKIGLAIGDENQRLLIINEFMARLWKATVAREKRRRELAENGGK